MYRLSTLCLLSSLYFIAAQFNIEATNGVYSIGFGTKSKAMGGVSMAIPQDALTALSNPAGSAWLGNRFDLSAEYIHAKYWEEISGNIFGKNGHADLNTFRNLASLEAGYNRMISSCLSTGATLAPLAGGIVHHRQRPSDTPGEGPHELTIAYIALSPYLASRIGSNHSIGISIDIVAGIIDIKGFQSIQNRDGSAFPTKVTNNGLDFAMGTSLRLGWLSKLSGCLSVGGAYRSQTFMSHFKEYKGLLTPEGQANLPQRIDLGIAFKPSCSTVLALDIGKVYYKQIRAWSGPPFDSDRPLWGAKKGPGLGWKDQYILKIGASQPFYYACQNFEGRLGFNYGESPIPNSRSNNSNSTPATTKYHLTGGLSWLESSDREWTISYVAAIRGRVRGTIDSIPTAAGGGSSDLYSTLHQIQMGYTYKW